MNEKDDRLFASLSHLSIIIPWWGIIAPIVIWAKQKDKSEFVRFQALQAVWYHILRIVVQLITFMGFFISFFCITLFSIFVHGGRPPSQPPIVIVIPFIILLLAFIIDMIFFLCGIYGAYSVYRGRDFRYLLIGRMVHRHLYDRKEEKEKKDTT